MSPEKPKLEEALRIFQENWQKAFPETKEGVISLCAMFPHQAPEFIANFKKRQTTTKSSLEKPKKTT